MVRLTLLVTMLSSIAYNTTLIGMQSEASTPAEKKSIASSEILQKRDNFFEAGATLQPKESIDLRAQKFITDFPTQEIPSCIGYYTSSTKRQVFYDFYHNKFNDQEKNTSRVTALIETALEEACGKDNHPTHPKGILYILTQLNKLEILINPERIKLAVAILQKEQDRYITERKSKVTQLKEKAHEEKEALNKRLAEMRKQGRLEIRKKHEPQRLAIQDDSSNITACKLGIELVTEHLLAAKTNL